MSMPAKRWTCWMLLALYLFCDVCVTIAHPWITPTLSCLHLWKKWVFGTRVGLVAFLFTLRAVIRGSTDTDHTRPCDMGWKKYFSETLFDITSKHDPCLKYCPTFCLLGATLFSVIIIRNRTIWSYGIWKCLFCLKCHMYWRMFL